MTAPETGTTRMTESERDELARRAAEANKRSEQSARAKDTR
ncbi:hypothetical protein [Streptomyces diacarni]|nr:hypothetical protein [Streptomyces diacarni]